jgi:hypothetical protein
LTPSQVRYQAAPQPESPWSLLDREANGTLPQRQTVPEST